MVMRLICLLRGLVRLEYTDDPQSRSTSDRLP
jgi:hypothetical protein